MVTKKPERLLTYLIFLLSICRTGITVNAQDPDSRKNEFKWEHIFPVQGKHVHSSSVVELPDGNLFSCRFEGSGERTANDVMIRGASLKKGEQNWSAPFTLADTPDNPDCNPVLFLDGKNRLHLVWIVVVANKWEASILKTRISTDFHGEGAPKWDWQDIILLKPGLPIVGRGNIQPAIVRKKDGTLTAYMRYNGDSPGRIQISSSKDNGFTWSSAEKTGFPNPGSSVRAISLKSGNLILAYNDSETDRHTLAISLSDDESQTWKWTKHLENDPDCSFAYPCVIQTRDGRIHVTYTWNLKKEKTIKYVSFTEDFFRITDKN